MFQTSKKDLRKIPVPSNRYSPLKENWMKIFTPIVEHLHLQIRFNLKTRNVEIKVCYFFLTVLSNVVRLQTPGKLTIICARAIRVSTSCIGSKLPISPSKVLEEHLCTQTF